MKTKPTSDTLQTRPSKRQAARHLSALGARPHSEI